MSLIEEVLQKMPRWPATTKHVLTLTRDTLRSSGLLAPAPQEKLISRQYQQIKRPLIANARSRGAASVPNAQLIMVASALQGEGKTFSSINLALSLALEKDTEVLLVDADVPNPQLSKLLGVADRPGLLDVLQSDSLDVESFILSTTISGLSFLPAGQAAENPTELLTSSRMQQTLARISPPGRNRIVLFDSPPVLLTSEAHALVDRVGQVVLIVQACVTPQQSVLNAISHLRGRWIGLVLNQCQRQESSSYYGYGYGVAGGGR
jgi:protein-tyrosine kinase